MTTTNTAAPYPSPDIAAAVSRALRNANDRPNPELDAARATRKYAAMAQDFRRSAWQHLESGDLPQASNKAWGMVAETVKAVSSQHGGAGCIPICARRRSGCCIPDTWRCPALSGACPDDGTLRLGTRSPVGNRRSGKLGGRW